MDASVTAYIREWLGCMTALAILAVLIDLALPANSVKQYAQYGTGLLFLLQLLQPVAKVLDWLRSSGWGG